MTYQKNKLSVWLFSMLLKFSGWLQNIPNKVTPAPFRLLQSGSAFWQSRILYIAARLNIATLLKNKALKSSEIAKLTSSNEDATYRMLRFLTAMGIFEQTANNSFRNNKLSEYLKDDNPKNIKAMILMHNSRELSVPWYEQLEQGIRDGTAPFKLSYGQELFSYMEQNSNFNSLFSKAMDSVEALAGNSFVTDFNWDRFHRIIDVGGSKGSKALSIIKHYPQLKAQVIDRPKVIAEARHYWQGIESQSTLDRISFVEGDVLDSIPAANNDKDIYFLSAVLHTLSNSDCVTALKNIVLAIGNSKAKLAIFELVMSDSKPDLASTSFDMQMFMASQGRERTAVEWKLLFDQSRFILEETVNLRTFGKIMLLRVAHNDEVDQQA